MRPCLTLRKEKTALAGRLSLPYPRNFTTKKPKTPSIPTMHREDLLGRSVISINVHHPAEDGRMEVAARSVAGIPGGNGALQTKLGPTGSVPFAFGGQAKIGVQVPRSNAQRHTLVELILGRALGHRVHRALEFVAVRRFSVEERRRPRWIKRERFQKAVFVVGEVIFRLWHLGREDLVAVG